MLAGRVARLPAPVQWPDHSSHGAAWRRSSRRHRPVSLSCSGTHPIQVETSQGLLEVAALEPDDLNAASVVLIRSFATSPDSVTVNLRDVGDFLKAYLAPENKGAFYTARLTLADTAALLVGRKHLIVGTAAISVEDSSNQKTSQHPQGGATIANMAVDQRYRKQGIARMLLRACEQYASAHGIGSVSLVVHRDNIPARQLYQSSGFSELPPAKPVGLSGLLRFGSDSKHTVMAKRVGGEPSDYSV